MRDNRPFEKPMPRDDNDELVPLIVGRQGDVRPIENPPEVQFADNGVDITGVE
jgi:hypothetical protein